MLKPLDVIAVFTTYEPNQALIRNIETMSKQVNSIIIVDDGSKMPISLEILTICSLNKKVTLYRNEENSGIAYSLNRGIEIASNNGFDWAVTMDQDSEPTHDFIYQLCTSLNNLVSRENVALLTPTVVDSSNPRKISKLLINNKKIYFELTDMSYRDRDDLILAITSGCLTSIPKIKVVGGFPTEYFIDYVDSFLSLKLIQSGYKIAFSSQAKLLHNLGNPEVKNLLGNKVRTLNHSGFRRYYIARNTIFMYREFYRTFPNWILYDVYIGIYSLISILLFERNKFEKLGYSLKGIYHGLLGVKGKLH
ncbi:glycosyl transferase [Vibrio inusitatus NBRC 102082]|uniref:Glycosyl transferase n=1 Tax=Vibrio inusitatus NBRC 102082 TaxID=1219070 RepID=A0A4Y3I082_9VIBR|nr:glycosyltransferase [Vibrio inusitatus]GEA52827.1 glycosyl transferase [Vibrio inusitatus NBRC 102082]